MSGPIYLGFDLSTQQLKCLAMNSDLKVEYQTKFDFDADSRGFDVHKGVLVKESEGEVFAPVAMWLQAIDGVLERLKDTGLDFSRVKGLCGSGMQHGSVFWSEEAEQILSQMNPSQSLEAQLDAAFSHPYTPNWQDSSTQKECEEFDKCLGDQSELAHRTGSKAHHRFTGPQIMKFRRKYPKKYEKTSRITLVSSTVATLFLGNFAPFDISDVCGMNLRDITTGTWNEKLLALTAGESGVEDLKSKLGDVPEDGGATFGLISDYFVQRHGFSPDCAIIAATGDNPSTILALPLRQNDAIVSLGTSSTFLMVTPEYKPDPSVHFFNSPTTAGLYMFMLCYKNGGLAREKVRDAINQELGTEKDSWEKFDSYAATTPPLIQSSYSDTQKLGIYFPRPEIVPSLPAGAWHFEYNPATERLKETKGSPNPPTDDARVIIESQFLSMRLRSKDLVKSPGAGLPPQPNRIYLVGGGSKNKAIARIAGEVLGGSEGVFKLNVGENACALGACHKAVWGIERRPGQSFEDFISKRWHENEFVERIADGYQKGLFERYGQAVQGFEQMEQQLLQRVSTN